MNIEQLLSTALSQPKDAITYYMSSALAELYQDRSVIFSDSSSFGLAEYARAGLCQVSNHEQVCPQVDTSWHGPDYGLTESVVNGWQKVVWQAKELDIVWMSVSERFSTTRYYWIIASSKELAETFFVEVCSWQSRLRQEVLVFEAGCWHKSKELFTSIQDSTFERLILPQALKDELKADFRQFLDSREIFRRYGLPWKRGVLLIGPPGNGKTHSVKALINWLGVSCLYVKSFTSKHSTDQENIHSVFQRARQTTPCILVLEDLDSLITDKNRSYFLNEVDGFMTNDGILLLATTNHPERLDTAILERPSRFDRKYHFELPGYEERAAYMATWNASVDPELRISQDASASLAADTEGFSFAYLKELWLASLMRWINSAEPLTGQRANMDEIMAAQLLTLREQMTSTKNATNVSVEPGFVGMEPLDFSGIDEDEIE